MRTKIIALIGDYNKAVTAHTAIPLALELAKKSINMNINWSWVETEAIDSLRR
jgi:CTP synthase (UTP-ammonia lyase)